MRKIYWRRCSLSSRISSTLLMGALIFIVLFCIKQGGFMSIIYTASITCHQLEGNSLIESSSIPPHYLLVPYREFVLRTSISCRSFKLDEPKKLLSAFHPRYSPYLRGIVPVIVPYQNVTFSDIENLYTQISNSNQNRTSTTEQTPFAANVTFENIPYYYNDGMWYPIGFISAQRTAIIIPLQGRDYNAKAFILNIHAFARRQLLTYTVLLLEQVSTI